MSLSIEELDATVRAFYEGRGEQVRIYATPTKASHEITANMSPTIAKASSGYAEPGTRLHSPSL